MKIYLGMTNMDLDINDVDLELRELVKVMNEVGCIKTIDSCFGHTGDITCNHHSESFIGVEPRDAEKFHKFWTEFFKEYCGKTKTATGWIQFTLRSYPYEPYGLIRFCISPEHNPHVDQRGIDEKLAGISIMKSFCDNWKGIHYGSL
jgi:hypothetical protein